MWAQCGLLATASTTVPHWSTGTAVVCGHTCKCAAERQPEKVVKKKGKQEGRREGQGKRTLRTAGHLRPPRGWARVLSFRRALASHRWTAMS